MTGSSKARFLPGKAVGGGMGSPRIARSGLQSPRGWLFLAFLGVWLYLASQLLRLYPARVAEVRGLAFGVAGVGILGLFEFALFLDWLGAAFNPMALFAQSPVLDTGVIAGTALAFAGLASLVVGFAQSTDLFGRRERAVAQRAAQREESG